MINLSNSDTACINSVLMFSRRLVCVPRSVAEMKVYILHPDSGGFFYNEGTPLFCNYSVCVYRFRGLNGSNEWSKKKKLFFNELPFPVPLLFAGYCL